MAFCHTIKKPTCLFCVISKHEWLILNEIGSKSYKMVYYHTSANVKMMKNILLDYKTSDEISPYEYMKIYIEKCPEDTKNTKISWIADTFLSIQKHNNFFTTVAAHLSQEISEEDQGYFIIIFHAVIFQIEPKDMPFLYKCLFNLSKSLLNTFTKFLSNNEVLPFISQLAQTYYDAQFVTENIVNPLFTWQPYISEMGHSFGEYLKKIESRKYKPPTTAIQPNVLNRKGKKAMPTQSPLPATPPNSMKDKNMKKMLSRSVIDRKLKKSHETNQQKATYLLNQVKTKNFNYAQDKSDKYYKTLSNIKEEMENDHIKPVPKPRQKFVIKNPQPVKENAANLKRTHKRIQSAQKEELLWLEDLISHCRNTTKVEEMEEYDRQERERERLYDIERKHLMGQISYEQALIAKRKYVEGNKKKYEEFLKEKETWLLEIEQWKKNELERNKKQVEKLSFIELNMIEAKNESVAKKKEMVEKFKKESELILARAMKEKQEELERRISMIKDIKILAMIAKKAKAPKILDLTETSGLGLLCEMSMAELQERLTLMKIGLSDELQKKKEQIREENMTAKQTLENTKNTIQAHMNERAALRKHKKKTDGIFVENSSYKEINNLKRILDEKRKLRMQLSK